MAELITKMQIIKARTERVYQMWSDVERFPDFIEPLISVSRTGQYSSLWKFTGRSGREITWEAQLTQIDMNARMAWNTLAGDIRISGQVTFQQLTRNETQVTLVIEYGATASLPEADHIGPQQVEELVRDYLSRFKAYVERTSDIPVAG